MNKAPNGKRERAVDDVREFVLGKGTSKCKGPWVGQAGHLPGMVRRLELSEHRESGTGGSG